MNRVMTLALAILLGAAAVVAWNSLDSSRESAKSPTLTPDAGAPAAPSNVKEPPKSAPPATSENAAPVEAAPAPVAPARGAAASQPFVPPVRTPIPHQSVFTDRQPDEVHADGTQVFHDYPFQVRQPDGSMKTVGVTLTYKPTDVAESAVGASSLPKKER
jgi:hypothetical protein